MGTGIRVWTAALALALAGASLMVVALPESPAAPAFVEPAFRFDPASSEVGETVDILGTGWRTLSGPVSIFEPGVDASDANSEPFATAAELEPGGGFVIEDVEVPPLAGDEQSFFACQSCPELDGADTPASARATLTVLPTLDLAADEGLPEETIPVTGSGWLIGTEPVLLFESEVASSNPGDLIASYDVQGDGSLAEGSSLEVPESDPGAYDFYACQRCGQGEDAWGLAVSFTVNDPGSPPTIFEPDFVFGLDVAEAEQGQKVTVKGRGWSDDADDVFVYADASEVGNSRPLATGSVLGGSFTTTITIPETDADVLSIFACQECGRNPDLTAERDLRIVAAARVEARLTLSTDSGSPGTEFRAIGTGWPDGEARLFARTDAGRRQPLGTPTARNGSFEADLVVPEIGFGPIDIVACQLCETAAPRQDVASFTVVKPEQDGPSLTVDPQEVRSGDRVVVSGAGWSADDGEVTVFLRPIGSPSPRTEWLVVSPDGAGTLAEVVEAPDLDAGSYRVVACQRCRDAPGFPRATGSLVISGGLNLLVLLVAGLCLILLVAALVVVHLRRAARPRSIDDTDPAASPEPPVVSPYADPVFDVRLRAPPGGALAVELPRLDVVAHPDPARLADQVEVRT